MPDGSSFRQIAVTFEAWIVLAVIVIISTITVSIRDTEKPAGIILADPEGNEYYFPAIAGKDGNGAPMVTYETDP